MIRSIVTATAIVLMAAVGLFAWFVTLLGGGYILAAGLLLILGPLALVDGATRLKAKRRAGRKPG
ncbi:hypothetical protein FBY35_5955 [Streptomyces sp. SLBN-118]|uniref:hypothetical protein n=1 Tax=Streptomyces sp. SLBN-118 TaxID=2768454 RepID=UPI001150C4F5|nr:hypothetical protein [Streptomyces sp. SLBN-118]TQK44451.1 hypothetical protein FBY35_5955 [Streptomyces sp. SLBN-118]